MLNYRSDILWYVNGESGILSLVGWWHHSFLICKRFQIRLPQELNWDNIVKNMYVILTKKKKNRENGSIQGMSFWLRGNELKANGELTAYGLTMT